MPDAAWRATSPAGKRPRSSGPALSSDRQVDRHRWRLRRWRWPGSRGRRWGRRVLRVRARTRLGRIRDARRRGRVHRVGEVDAVTQMVVGRVTHPHAVLVEDPAGHVGDRPVRVHPRAGIEQADGRVRLVGQRLPGHDGPVEVGHRQDADLTRQLGERVLEVDLNRRHLNDAHCRRSPECERRRRSRRRGGACRRSRCRRRHGGGSRGCGRRSQGRTCRCRRLLGGGRLVLGGRGLFLGRRCLVFGRGGVVVLLGRGRILVVGGRAAAHAEQPEKGKNE